MYKRILVATDGSELSAKAVAAATDLALLAQAELVGVHVVHRQAHSYFEGATVMSIEETEAAQRRSDEAGQRMIDAFRKAALDKGVRGVQAVVVTSNQVAEAIIEVAKTHECDLIVMASHGRRSLARLLMGSETLNVLTHSHVPVLTLR